MTLYILEKNDSISEYRKVTNTENILKEELDVTDKCE